MIAATSIISITKGLSTRKSHEDVAGGGVIVVGADVVGGDVVIGETEVVGLGIAVGEGVILDKFFDILLLPHTLSPGSLHATAKTCKKYASRL